MGIDLIIFYNLSDKKSQWITDGHSIQIRRNERMKEGNILFNNELNTFYLWLYCVGHIVKDHSDSERGNPLPPHGLLLQINSKGSFICNIPKTG